MTRVGFIGLGDMGGAIAERVIAAGFPTVLWARRPETLQAFDSPHVEIATSPADLAARADVIGVCVWADDDVRHVLGGDEGVLAGCQPGTVIAVHSTILPETCRELAANAGDQGVTFLDAPVSGGRMAVRDGTLVVAVGGDYEAVERCRPYLASFGNPVVHVGPVGSGQLVKLVNNALLAANMTLADDALTIGQMLGVTPEAMHQVLRLGSGRSFALDVVFGARASAEVRERAREPLEKDVQALATDPAVREIEGVTAILEAAGEAIRRLAEPPPRWNS